MLFDLIDECLGTLDLETLFVRSFSVTDFNVKVRLRRFFPEMLNFVERHFDV